MSYRDRVNLMQALSVLEMESQKERIQVQEITVRVKVHYSSPGM